jgi:cell division protein FtsQ
MSRIAVAADKRFRRAHVTPARPKRNWRALAGRAVRVALVGGALGFAAYRGAGVAAHVLTIERIVVQGTEQMSNGEVLAVLNGLRGQSIIRTDLDFWRKRLLSSPWVRDASLRRSLPSTVEVVVSERRPLGVGRIDGQMYLVDERGVIIDEYGPQFADFDLPIIDGLPAPADGTVTDSARADLAARVIAALRSKPDIARRLSQVDVREVHNAAVILSGETAVIHLGDQQFLQRLQAYLELAPSLHERIADIDHVDLRFDGRIYVRPAAQPATAGRSQNEAVSLNGPRRKSGAKRAVSGRARRRHVEGDSGRR